MKYKMVSSMLQNDPGILFGPESGRKNDRGIVFGPESGRKKAV